MVFFCNGNSRMVWWPFHHLLGAAARRRPALRMLPNTILFCRIRESPWNIFVVCVYIPHKGRVAPAQKKYLPPALTSHSKGSLNGIPSSSWDISTRSYEGAQVTGSWLENGAWALVLTPAAYKWRNLWKKIDRNQSLFTSGLSRIVHLARTSEKYQKVLHQGPTKSWNHADKPPRYTCVRQNGDLTTCASNVGSTTTVWCLAPFSLGFRRRGT